MNNKRWWNNTGWWFDKFLKPFLDNTNQKPNWVVNLVNLVIMTAEIFLISVTLTIIISPRRPPVTPPPPPSTSSTLREGATADADDPDERNTLSLASAGAALWLTGESRLLSLHLELDFKRSLLIEKEGLIVRSKATTEYLKNGEALIRRLEGPDLERQLELYTKLTTEETLRETELKSIELLEFEIDTLEVRIKAQSLMNQARSTAARRVRRGRRQLRMSSDSSALDRRNSAIRRTSSTGPSDSETLRNSAIRRPSSTGPSDSETLRIGAGENDSGYE